MTRARLCALVVALSLVLSACSGSSSAPTAEDGPAPSTAPTAAVDAHAGVDGSAADRFAGSQLQQTLIARPEVTGWQGALLDPAVSKPDFTLTDTDGQPYDFVAETADAAVTFLYFGYATCPDICPTHMASLATALREVPEDIAAEVEVVFVSVDPERDEPILRTYLDSFDPSFVGLVGTPAEVNAAMHDVGVHPSAIAMDGDYPPTHPVNIVAFTDDIAHLAYPFGVNGGAIAEDLQRLATEGPPA